MCRFRSLRIHSILALLIVSAGSVQADGERPALYLISVGVSQYQHRVFENGVRFASKDAQDLAALFQLQEGKLFERVHSKVLTDAEATRANIEGAFGWLKTKAVSDSYVVVFFAGHGGPDSLGQFTYLPHDAHPLLHSSRMSGAFLQQTLEKIAGRRLLILDTCHAGAVSLSTDSYVTLAGCKAQEKSGELASIRNGFFTSLLIEALQGKADADADGTVTLAELNSYLQSNLATLTGGRQHVVMNHPAGIALGLPLAQLNGRIQTAFVRTPR
ncbi:MAG: caspase family protein [Planctomycetes bacterium]|nr:caspase family protein [Planctomycetota bacterium]